MKVVVFTSDALRHKFIANTLAQTAGEALIISEAKTHDRPADSGAKTSLDEHWRERQETEKKFFAGNDAFKAPVLSLAYKEASSPHVAEKVKKFEPDALFVFGASLLKEPVLSAVPNVPFINLHLGLSPYYRGSGTNFWPFVNNELDYVGSTILHIDPGVDTGDVIAHVRPVFEENDTVHTAGCKVIKASAEALVKIIGQIKEGRKLNRVAQWTEPSAKVYKRADFTLEALQKYRRNIQGGMVKAYVVGPKKTLRLISL